MTVRRTLGLFAAALIMMSSGPGCALIGPSCIARREQGAVTVIRGEVAAGELVSHLVRYDTRGSQNNSEITWDGQSATTAAQIRVHATRAGCTDFQLPPVINTGA